MVVENFWELVQEYRQLGFDPLRWIPTCSNEVESHIMQSSLKEIRRSTIKVMPSWFDAFHYMEDYSSLKIGKLFFGATAIANTLKELPTRYDQVEDGMQIIISNKLGSMPAVSL